MKEMLLNEIEIDLLPLPIVAEEAVASAEAVVVVVATAAAAAVAAVVILPPLLLILTQRGSMRTIHRIFSSTLFFCKLLQTKTTKHSRQKKILFENERGTN